MGYYHHIGSPDERGFLSDNPVRHEQRAEIVAPSVPTALVTGCVLTKLAGRKIQEKHFALDNEFAKVWWTGRLSRKSFNIDDIKSIRFGLEAASSWKSSGVQVDVHCCFTINYAPSQSSKDLKTLNLLAQTQHMCRLWVNTLEALAKHREELMTEMTGSERQSVLKAHWESELVRRQLEDNNPSLDRLNLRSITHLCRKLHIHCPRSVIEEGFKNVDVDGLGLLTFDQFRAFVARLRSRFDIKPLFNQLIAPGTDGISKQTFLQFLAREQGVNTNSTRGYWEAKFDNLAGRSHCSVPEYARNQYMDFVNFTSFMMSQDCHIYASGDTPKSSFGRPLNEYFISSSHNTYLIGRQVGGTSSVEAYVAALRKGCRSVEIDCWDGENDTPRVTHGYTRTTSVPFVDVIKAINRCAFDASPYPVILSLEVHCNPVQQARMVHIMKENIPSERLLTIPLAEHTDTLPSPEELKWKLLIKVKATNPQPSLSLFIETASVTRKRSTSSPIRRPIPTPSSSSQHIIISAATATFMMTPPESISSPTDRSMSPTSEEEEQSDANRTPSISSEAPPVKIKTSKIIKDLADLGVYLQGYSFRGNNDLNFRQFNHIFSLNESTAIGLCQLPSTKALFERHNTDFMCRIYPKGFRVNSSNFDPNTFWRRGVQMVALNRQTYDIHMQMNEAMFAAGHDQMGYVLKPQYLRQPDRFSTNPDQKAKLPRRRIEFSVKVISAQQLPLLSTMGKNDLISPYVEIQMFSAEDKAKDIASGQGGEEVSDPNGYHGIGSPYVRRTKTVPGNGFNPQFNDVIELQLETKYSELVFVRFIVYQSGKSPKQLAVFTAKLDSLQLGYRHLPLYNSNGEELIFSSLFCQITKKPPAESVLASEEGLPYRSRSIRGYFGGDRGRRRGRTNEAKMQNGHACEL